MTGAHADVDAGAGQQTVLLYGPGQPPFFGPPMMTTCRTRPVPQDPDACEQTHTWRPGKWLASHLPICQGAGPAVCASCQRGGRVCHTMPCRVRLPCGSQVTVIERTSEDEVLVIATDGLWDVFTCKVGRGAVWSCGRSRVVCNEWAWASLRHRPAHTPHRRACHMHMRNTCCCHKMGMGTTLRRAAGVFGSGGACRLGRAACTHNIAQCTHMPCPA